MAKKRPNRAKKRPNMAKKRPNQKKEVAVRGTQVPMSEAAADLMSQAFESEMTGNQNVTRDCLTVPFLRIAQKLTDQVDPDNQAYIEGLKPGHFYSTASNTGFGEEVKIIILHFDRQFTIWGQDRGPFKGILTEQDLHVAVTNGSIQQDGVKYYDSEHDYVDTRNFYCFLPDYPEQGIIIFPLVSTGIRHSRNILTMLEGFKVKHPSTGELVTAPYCMSVLQLKTAKNENDKGTWYTIGTDKATLCKSLGYIQDEKTKAALMVQLSTVKGLAEKANKFDYSDMAPSEKNVTRDAGIEM